MMAVLLFTAVVAVLALTITVVAYVAAKLLLWWDRRTAAHPDRSLGS